MLIGQYGMPDFIQAAAYGAGAVTGFGLLALIAFKNTFSAIEDTKSTMVVLSMMHYLAALIPLMISKVIVENVSVPAYGFFMAGMSVSVVYNALSVLEEDIAELLS
ncbi:hypothetical protein [Candidatus Nanohalobium constans]|nr:hypothetical protein [Candidatus Nanohalobium constans]